MKNISAIFTVKQKRNLTKASFDRSDGRVVRAFASGAAGLGLIPSPVNVRLDTNFAECVVVD